MRHVRKAGEAVFAFACVFVRSGRPIPARTRNGARVNRTLRQARDNNTWLRYFWNFHASIAMRNPCDSSYGVEVCQFEAMRAADYAMGFTTERQMHGIDEYPKPDDEVQEAHVPFEYPPWWRA